MCLPSQLEASSQTTQVVLWPQDPHLHLVAWNIHMYTIITMYKYIIFLKPLNLDLLLVKIGSAIVSNFIYGKSKLNIFRYNSMG